MWDIILSVTTIILSIIAIGINVYQNIKTKKQNLFDRRLRLYLELMDMWNLYKSNIFFLDKLNPTSIDVGFSYITNSSTFYMLADIMQTPLDHSKKAMFLTDCENLKKDAQEFRFVYNKKYSKCADFIEAYVNMIQQFHRQQILIKSFDKQNKDNVDRGYNALEYDYVEKACKELANKGLFPSIQNIKQLYEEIEKEKLIEKLKKVIKF